ncbi:MAG: ATP-dependent DNA ligase [Saprospirales bacterium]|nr:ATP-dependent DNA ligase [Saprospirales bacterium]MBK8493159.1 ATP-dependent DNA ligase [Saprospirales bacterium]
MKNFAQLFAQLDQTAKAPEKVAALVSYFESAEASDKLWTIAMLSRRPPGRVLTTAVLRKWALEYANLPNWLFEESYKMVGDLAETIALILPPAAGGEEHTLSYWIDFARALAENEESEKKHAVFKAWSYMPPDERFLFNKLLTGGLRLGMSQKLMIMALAQHTGLEENLVAHRLISEWSPDESSFEELLFQGEEEAALSKPYPFFLAYPLEQDPQKLGEVHEWQFERKWEGIRAQLIIRQGQLFVWSRAEELLTDKFPEYHSLLESLPNGIALDGEILPFKDGQPLPLNELHTRLVRKSVTKKALQETPVIFKAYDVLEWQGSDLRTKPLTARRELLEQLAPAGEVLHVSELLEIESWEEAMQERDKAREYHCGGLMIKRKSSPYRSGRKQGDWWKYKVPPFTIDAVLLYAQRGDGRKANLYTEFTFAVWDEEGQLVPFTKTGSGLTESELFELTEWVRKNTVERFGPVRSVKPEFVFEIEFDGIDRSTRHKSGVTLRAPRVVRWRRDGKVEEAGRLTGLREMLK